MTNVGNVFYPTFTNFFYFLHVFLRFLTFFLHFHLNVYYIYAVEHGKARSLYSGSKWTLVAQFFYIVVLPRPARVHKPIACLVYARRISRHVTGCTDDVQFFT